MARAILSVLVVAVLSFGVASASHALNNRPPTLPAETVTPNLLHTPAATPTTSAPTPAATGVTPVVSTVAPRPDIVTPESATAERTTSTSAAGEPDEGGSSSPFAGVRGGLIGGGIGFGVFLLVVALVVATRAGLRRVRP